MLRANDLFISVFLIFYTAVFFSCGSNPYRSGEKGYKLTCANCHLDDGKGLGNVIPPLAGSDYLAAHRNELPCIIRHGLEDTITVNGRVYAEKMEGLLKISDIQMTNILNYMQVTWGDPKQIYTLEEVRNLLNGCNTLPTQDTKTKQ
ncbi:MAG: cytochrome c [Bacteroidota bacterium]